MNKEDREKGEERVCSCGKPLESEIKKTRYCPECRRARIEFFHNMRYFRQAYSAKAECNPEEAKKIKEAMLAEEGPEFTEMVLGKILEDTISNSSSHQGHVKARFEKRKQSLKSKRNKDSPHIESISCPRCKGEMRKRRGKRDWRVYDCKDCGHIQRIGLETSNKEGG